METLHQPAHKDLRTGEEICKCGAVRNLSEALRTGRKPPEWSKPSTRKIDDTESYYVISK